MCHDVNISEIPENEILLLNHSEETVVDGAQRKGRRRYIRKEEKLRRMEGKGLFKGFIQL